MGMTNNKLVMENKIANSERTKRTNSLIIHWLVTLVRKWKRKAPVGTTVISTTNNKHDDQGADNSYANQGSLANVGCDV
jgi:hypothetical protein